VTELVTATELTTAAETLLNTTHLGVYVGDVPTKPPAHTDGRVLPYAVIWATPGFMPDYSRSIGGDDGIDSGLEWPVQVTVAAGDPAWCLTAAVAARRALAGAVLVAGCSALREDATTSPILRDPDVDPPRWFTPLLYRCVTP
jgi:hypothetical protein